MTRIAGFRIESEPRRLLGRYLAAIDHEAERIRPDERRLDEWFEGYRRRHRRRLAVDLWLAERRLESGARILECGSIPPLVTAALASLGFELQGVDIAPERFGTAIALLDLDVQRCDLERERLPFEDGTFDGVLFNEIFEHLRVNPIETMGEVRRVLRPGGVLFLSTPNLRSLRGVRNLLVRHRAAAASGDLFSQYEKLDTLGHMGHVREYTAAEVTEFLGKLGYRIEQVVYRGGYGRGVVGLVERLLPTWRPFFSVLATRGGDT
jgi:SAM-dependent methyltransferase